jgi:hypothetical protein
VLLNVAVQVVPPLMLYCHEPEPPAGELMVIIPSFVPLHVGWVLLTDAERITGRSIFGFQDELHVGWLVSRICTS